MKEERIYLADKVVSRSRNLRGIRRYWRNLRGSKITIEA